MSSPSTSVLIRGGTVVNADREQRADVLCIDGVIAAVGENLDAPAGARVIDGSEGTTEYWLVETVKRLSARAGIATPEVAVYEGEPNAFATGAFKNSALVAVSTGLLQGMSREEVEAVLGHEIGHVANGDMVTLTLIQGVVNTFVVFLARVVGYIIDRVVLKNEREVGIGYYATVFVCEIMFSILASPIVAWFSRQREFRADAGSARLLGSAQPMVKALARLGGLEPGALPKSVATPSRLVYRRSRSATSTTGDEPRHCQPCARWSGSGVPSSRCAPPSPRMPILSACCNSCSISDCCCGAVCTSDIRPTSCEPSPSCISLIILSRSDVTAS